MIQLFGLEEIKHYMHTRTIIDSMFYLIMFCECRFWVPILSAYFVVNADFECLFSRSSFAGRGAISLVFFQFSFPLYLIFQKTRYSHTWRSSLVIAHSTQLIFYLFVHYTSKYYLANSDDWTESRYIDILNSCNIVAMDFVGNDV